MSLPLKGGTSYPNQILNDLPEMPASALKASPELREWWRITREILKRVNLGVTAINGDSATPDSAVDEAPTDGKQYGRQSEAWTKIVHGDEGIPEAPMDNRQYGRQSKAWTVIKSTSSGGGGGIDEAPVNGKGYLRKNANWSELYQPVLNYNDIALQDLPDPAYSAVGTCFRLETGGEKWGQQFDPGDMVTVHYYRSLNVRRYIAIAASVIDGGQFE